MTEQEIKKQIEAVNTQIAELYAKYHSLNTQLVERQAKSYSNLIGKNIAVDWWEDEKIFATIKDIKVENEEVNFICSSYIHITKGIEIDVSKDAEFQPYDYPIVVIEETPVKAAITYIESKLKEYE